MNFVFVKLIVLLGQTSSGKSEMAIDLAKQLGDSWIINCDSRQVYRDLDIGTGKVNGEWKENIFYYRDIRHYLIDYMPASVSEFTMVNYIQDFTRLLNQRGLPKYVILTGGTGLYAKAIVEKYDLGILKPEFVDQHSELRKSLMTQSLDRLQQMYEEVSKTRVVDDAKANLNHSDYHNPRRLISKILTSYAKENNWLDKIQYPEFESTHVFGISLDQHQLKEKIKQRLESRVEAGLVAEVESLQYLGIDRLLNLGLEYRLTQLFLENSLGEPEWREKLLTENYQYAKRQLTWLKKQPDLIWIENLEEISKALSI
jgi:tRNA dimethylallyltransferase